VSSISGLSSSDADMDSTRDKQMYTPDAQLAKSNKEQNISVCVRLR
jgi:hypothetical protein